MQAVEITINTLSGIVVLQTALSLIHSRAWWVRIFDFPRIQILLMSLALLIALAWVDGGPDGHSWWDWTFLVLLLLAITVQVRQILPYTRLWRHQSPATSTEAPRDRRLRVVVSNVCMQNRSFERWHQVVTAEDPDVIIAVETDDWWDEKLRALSEAYPEHVRQPQDNTYGMVLYSRLPIRQVEVKHLVEKDVPSIFTLIEVPCGAAVHVVVIHPRPPRPDIGQDSDLRDAELVRAAEIIREFTRPFLVAGDLNDVAWSHTTHLFQRIARVLDPRIGRGIFATFHADHWYLRYPLDHMFHSADFELVELRRLGHVGSDHFPMLIDIALRVCAPTETPVEKPDHDDWEEAEDAEEDAERRLEEETPQERRERRQADC